MKTIIYKTLISCFLNISFVLISAAQSPEKILPITKVIREKSWYTAQKGLWENVTKEKPADEEAWINYYSAARNIWVLEGYSKDAEIAKKEIIRKMETAIPGTFAFNYLKSWDLGIWEPSSLAFAEKGQQLRPSDTRLLPEVVVRYEIKNDAEKRKSFNNTWFRTGEYSQGLLNYNYNVLASLEKNAIILTVGDNDTYPLWMIQDVMGFRRDVIVINTPMMRLTDYRNNMFSRSGITPGKETLSQLEYHENMTEKERKEWDQKLFSAISQNSHERPVYIGLTAGTPEWVKAEQDHLYLVGLASLYSTKKTDHIAILRRNFENKYLMDYISTGFSPDPSAEFVNMINLNYIPSMLILYRHYKITGETEKCERIKNYIIKIAEFSKEKNTIINMINE